MTFLDFFSGIRRIAERIMKKELKILWLKFNIRRCLFGMAWWDLVKKICGAAVKAISQNSGKNEG